MQISISSSRDCYLTVFNLLEDEKVIRLIPNTYKENNFLKANESLLFPSLEDKEKGMNLIAHLPQGKENTIETMYILAFKEPFHFSSEHIKEGILGVYDGSTAFIKDLLIDLVEIPLSERVEQFLQYSISK